MDIAVYWFTGRVRKGIHAHYTMCQPAVHPPHLGHHYERHMTTGHFHSTEQFTNRFRFVFCFNFFFNFSLSLKTLPPCLSFDILLFNSAVYANDVEPFWAANYIRNMQMKLISFTFLFPNQFKLTATNISAANFFSLRWAPFTNSNRNTQQSHTVLSLPWQWCCFIEMTTVVVMFVRRRFLQMSHFEILVWLWYCINGHHMTLSPPNIIRISFFFWWIILECPFGNSPINLCWLNICNTTLFGDYRSSRLVRPVVSSITLS